MDRHPPTTVNLSVPPPPVLSLPPHPPRLLPSHSPHDRTTTTPRFARFLPSVRPSVPLLLSAGRPYSPAFSAMPPWEMADPAAAAWDNGTWDEINASGEWQKGCFSVLCGCYALVSFVALVQLVRIQIRVPEFGWTTQKTFHFMNFIVNGLRAILFGFYYKVFLIRPRALEMALLDFPGLLFFTTYTLLVLFWAEIYHQARNLPIDKLRPTYLIINGTVYLVQVVVWVYAGIGINVVAIEIAELIFAVFSLVAALGFALYGGRLYIMLRRFPIQSRGRQKKMAEVGFVTTVCCLCFVVRTCVVTYSAFKKGADLDVLDHPILNFVYYMIVEVIPSALVLFILRKLPPKRVSDQYHPIR